jgi:hypothetical protein
LGEGEKTWKFDRGAGVRAARWPSLENLQYARMNQYQAKYQAEKIEPSADNRIDENL